MIILVYFIGFFVFLVFNVIVDKCFVIGGSSSIFIFGSLEYVGNIFFGENVTFVGLVLKAYMMFSVVFCFFVCILNNIYFFFGIFV